MTKSIISTFHPSQHGSNLWVVKSGKHRAVLFWHQRYALTISGWGLSVNRLHSCILSSFRAARQRRSTVHSSVSVCLACIGEPRPMISPVRVRQPPSALEQRFGRQRLPRPMSQWTPFLMIALRCRSPRPECPTKDPQLASPAEKTLQPGLDD